MHCPFCNEKDTKVIDSRLAFEGAQVRRRRKCEHCGERFISLEMADLQLPQIIKRNKRCVSFDKEKLLSGILRALEKRPITGAEVDALMQRLLKKLREAGTKEISSRQLGEWVMAELRTLDQVAYIRFASVYCSFQDLNAFSKTITQLRLSSQEDNDVQNPNDQKD
jgi:transcriptional repressor NrdR